MKIIIFTILITFFSTSVFCQSSNNIFYSFEEFLTDNPSGHCEFELIQRTDGNVFMTGGITNFRLKKIKPSSKAEELNKKIWGVAMNSSIYINSYPYSGVIGYNEILGDGFYKYFIGEPAITYEKQVELGIIKENEPQKPVCCQTSYVILPSGKVKWLTPKLLQELISDNQALALELKKDKIKQEDAIYMFQYLDQYNRAKK